MRDDIVEDIRTLMAPCDPVQDNAENHAEHVLVSKCNEIMASYQPYPRHRFPWRRMAWAAVATGFAVVVAAAFVAVQLRPRSDGSAATPVMLQYRLTDYSDPATSNSLPQGSSRLLEIAKVAAAQPPLAHPAEDQVGYVATWEWNMATAVSGGSSASALVPQIDQLWATPGGKAIEVRKDGPAINLSGAQTPRSLVQAVNSGSSTMTYQYANQDTTASAWGFGTPVQTMTGSLAQVENDLIRGSEYFQGAVPAGDKTFFLMKSIADLNHQVVSASLESQLWTMLAGRGNVDYMGRVRDRAGREGEAFCTTTGVGEPGAERMILIISPQTGMLLGEEDLFLSNPGGLTIKHYPAVIGYTTYLTSRWVSELPPVRH
jgi:hypothetical protein